MGTFKR